jgi:hypothetical protein
MNKYIEIDEKDPEQIRLIKEMLNKARFPKTEKDCPGRLKQSTVSRILVERCFDPYPPFFDPEE